MYSSPPLLSCESKKWGLRDDIMTQPVRCLGGQAWTSIGTQAWSKRPLLNDNAEGLLQNDNSNVSFRTLRIVTLSEAKGLGFYASG